MTTAISSNSSLQQNLSLQNTAAGRSGNTLTGKTAGALKTAGDPSTDATAAASAVVHARMGAATAAFDDRLVDAAERIGELASRLGVTGAANATTAVQSTLDSARARLTGADAGSQAAGGAGLEDVLAQLGQLTSTADSRGGTSASDVQAGPDISAMVSNGFKVTLAEPSEQRIQVATTEPVNDEVRGFDVASATPLSVDLADIAPLDNRIIDQAQETLTRAVAALSAASAEQPSFDFSNATGNNELKELLAAARTAGETIAQAGGGSALQLLR